jgi:thiamine biosynthesis protein ThiS
VNLLVNGESTTLPPGTTVAELVHAVAGTERGVAVSIDREIVSRSTWREVQLHEGAHVEVLVAAAGG